MAKNARERIYAAFNALIAETDINRITVKDITEAAGVSRVSFYYHFRSVYDLAISIIEDDLRRQQALLIARKDFETAFCILLHTITDHLRLIHQLMNSEGIAEFVDRSQLWCEHLAEAVMPGKFIPSDKTADRTVLNFYRDAIEGVLLDWIDAEGQGDARKLASLLSHHFHGAYALKN